MHGPKMYGDNRNENVNCIERKLVMHGSKTLHGAILTKMKNREEKLFNLSFWIEGLT